MNETTQPTRSGLLWALLIFLGVFLVGVFTGWIWGRPGKTPDTVLSPNYQREYTGAKVKIEQLNRRIELKTDTIMRLKTELAVTGVRANQSQARINELSKRIVSKQSTAQVWTPELRDKVADCDSLVTEIQDIYIKEQDARIALADSLNVFYEGIIADKDSTIEQYKHLDTMNLKALVQAEDQKQKAQANNKSLRKKAGIGWLAAAIAGFFAIVTNL